MAIPSHPISQALCYVWLSHSFKEVTSSPWTWWIPASINGAQHKWFYMSSQTRPQRWHSFQWNLSLWGCLPLKLSYTAVRKHGPHGKAKGKCSNLQAHWGRRPIASIRHTVHKWDMFFDDSCSSVIWLQFSKRSDQEPRETINYAHSIVLRVRHLPHCVL